MRLYRRFELSHTDVPMISFELMLVKQIGISKVTSCLLWHLSINVYTSLTVGGYLGFFQRADHFSLKTTSGYPSISWV